MADIRQEHRNDDQGRPAGGYTSGVGFVIDWQNGPLVTPEGRREQSGAFVEDVIAAAIGRIRYYQEEGPFHCVENAVALGHLLAAAEVLAERTRGRTRRGVEGTHQQ